MDKTKAIKRIAEQAFWNHIRALSNLFSLVSSEKNLTALQWMANWFGPQVNFAKERIGEIQCGFQIATTIESIPPQIPSANGSPLQPAEAESALLSIYAEQAYIVLLGLAGKDYPRGVSAAARAAYGAHKKIPVKMTLRIYDAIKKFVNGKSPIFDVVLRGKKPPAPNGAFYDKVLPLFSDKTDEEKIAIIECLKTQMLALKNGRRGKPKAPTDSPPSGANLANIKDTENDANDANPAKNEDSNPDLNNKVSTNGTPTDDTKNAGADTGKKAEPSPDKYEPQIVFLDFELPEIKPPDDTKNKNILYAPEATFLVPRPPEEWLKILWDVFLHPDGPSLDKVTLIKRTGLDARFIDKIVIGYLKRLWSIFMGQEKNPGHGFIEGIIQKWPGQDFEDIIESLMKKDSRCMISSIEEVRPDERVQTRLQPNPIAKNRYRSISA